MVNRLKKSTLTRVFIRVLIDLKKAFLQKNKLNLQFKQLNCIQFTSYNNIYTYQKIFMFIYQYFILILFHKFFSEKIFSLFQFFFFEVFLFSLPTFLVIIQVNLWVGKKLDKKRKKRWTRHNLTLKKSLTRQFPG